MTMFEQYRQSLKLPSAEEIFDLIFYRPLAFLFVQLVKPFPITPNQVTVLSLLAGLAAAWQFAEGATPSLAIGAIWYAIANILDCADGQLARIKQSGTPLGRLVDGIADYISSVAIFVAIGIGLERTGESQWLLVVAAGLSSALHAMIFDRKQGEFISAVRGNSGGSEEEIERYLRQIEGLRAGFRKTAIRFYVWYLKLQRINNEKQGRSDRSLDVRIIRLWSFLGPTTNRTLLVICALVGKVDLFLWGVLVVGNLWLVVCLLFQSFSEASTLVRDAEKESHRITVNR